MPARRKNNVNLDALIQREDFEASDENVNTTSKITSISISELREDSGFFLTSVRKPDFQRETADWDIEKVATFIKSFVNGEFIPAVILWKSQAGLIFVIDGSHRLSSLIAWVNDDYGDKKFSLEAYEGEVPEEQKGIAKKAREMISKEIGQYSDYYKALTSKYADTELIVKARNMASRALPIQWIDGDVDTAERSFFNINQQAVPIDPTELKLLKKRKSASCIAARSIVKAGKGHKYWHSFVDDIQDTIESKANSIYKLLFEPTIQRPMKTLDVPICDKSNNALTLVFDFVCRINGETDTVDRDGTATIQCLERVEKVVQQMNSSYAGSYGLHPMIYCYSNRGNFRPASFYATVEFLAALNSKPDLLKKFVGNRCAFEDFIFNSDYIVQRIIDTQRRGLQSAKHIAEYFIDVISLLADGKSQDEIVACFTQSPKYGKIVSANNENSITSPNFSAASKSEVYIREAYTKAPRCAICGGLLHKHSISIDHVTRKRDGGVGTPENGQLTHPYCNTGVKS